MILADKIIDLRKKNGMSQEDLAEKMDVSRQSVSKWEGAQSVPDLNKILRMSEIFGVSTDYLLKDDIETAELSESDENVPPLRRVGMEQAQQSAAAAKKCSVKTALATALCIAAPTPFIMLGALSERYGDIVAVPGLALTLVIISIAVAVFIKTDSIMRPYKYLSEEDIDTEYGVSGLAKERLESFSPKYTNSIIIGVVLIILGAAAMLVTGALSERAGKNEDILGAAGVCLMLFMIAAGVYLMVRDSIIRESYEKLLEEGSFSREKKKLRRAGSRGINIMLIYWMCIVAVFLCVSFILDSWKYSWIVFAAGGVLTPVVAEIEKHIKSKSIKEE